MREQSPDYFSQTDDFGDGFLAAFPMPRDLSASLEREGNSINQSGASFLLQMDDNIIC
jgi:hypothetical protein